MGGVWLTESDYSSGVLPFSGLPAFSIAETEKESNILVIIVVVIVYATAAFYSIKLFQKI